MHNIIKVIICTISCTFLIMTPIVSAAEINPTWTGDIGYGKIKDTTTWVDDSWTWAGCVSDGDASGERIDVWASNSDGYYSGKTQKTPDELKQCTKQIGAHNGGYVNFYESAQNVNNDHSNATEVNMFLE